MRCPVWDYDGILFYITSQSKSCTRIEVGTQLKLGWDQVHKRDVVPQRQCDPPEIRGDAEFSWEFVKRPCGYPLVFKGQPIVLSSASVRSCQLPKNSWVPDMDDGKRPFSSNAVMNVINCVLWILTVTNALYHNVEYPWMQPNMPTIECPVYVRRKRQLCCHYGIISSLVLLAVLFTWKGAG